jgi:RHS repeat-associated protein
VDNGLGGVTTLTYRASTQCDNDCLLTGVPLLPFILPVVDQVTVDDSRDHPITTRYVFKQGRYDTASREFYGFGRAEVTDPLGTVASTEFHQDPAAPALKGRVKLVQVKDSLEKLWTQTEHTWNQSSPIPGLVRFAQCQRVERRMYGGDATSVATAQTFDYDDYGNVTQVLDEGDPADPVDDRRTVTTFHNVTDAGKWLLGNPKLVQTYSGRTGGTLLAQRRFSYDGTAYLTPPTKGLLTKEEEWLQAIAPEPQDQWFATMMGYDSQGNVTTVDDARSTPTTTYRTTTSYDPTGTYVTRIANVRNQSRLFTYDLRLGQVATTTDPNGQVTTTSYDTLGRVASVLLPGETLPSMTTSYALGSPISTTTACQRTQAGGGEELLCVKSFTDGLGRTIQVRAPAQDATKDIVTGVVAFNSRGLVGQQWLPYLDTMSTTYAPLPSGVAPPATYDYDILGRLVQTTAPDGSTTKALYDDRAVTLEDANTHQIRRTHDAYGRLLRVEELGGLTTPTTRYTYDLLNRLIEVRNAKDQPTVLTYDTLGRKIQMQDPDMGTWKYGYDAVDNLTQQTDARNVKTTFRYDNLNRLEDKTYDVTNAPGVPNPSFVHYTYDDAAVPFSAGRLTKVSDGSGWTSFKYDRLGQLIEETKSIEARTFVVSRTYDLLGRVTSLTYPVTGDVARYTYNRQGALDLVRLQSGTTTKTLLSNLVYNAAGQVRAMTYGNGVTTTSGFDPNTLQLTTLRSVTPTATVQDFTYTYDPAGNVKTITDAAAGGFQAFDYDVRHRLTRAEGPYPTETYGYDELGNLTQHGGLTLGYDLARPHAATSASGSQTLSLTYDANGNVKTRTDNQLTQTFTFDAENRLTEVALSPQEAVSVTFKPGWNLFSLPVIPTDRNVAAVFQNFAEDFEQIAKYSGVGNSFTHFTGVGGFNDFTALEYGVGYEVYCKNPNGATVTITGTRPTSLDKLIDPGWQLLPAVSLQRDTLARIFTGFDVEAAQTLNTGGTGTVAATDVQPAQAYFIKSPTTGNWSPPVPSGKTSFLYDGDGGRVKTVQGTVSTFHVGELLEQTNSQTTLSVFAGSLRIASKEPDGALRYYHQDHLGSSHVVTNEAGQVLERTDHRPFGAIHQDTGTAAVAHHFTGQRQGELRGLIAFPGRVYDPVLGRFLQADPFIQDPTDPQTFNRYSYVRNNPLNLVDPSGFSFLEDARRFGRWLLGGGNEDRPGHGVPISPPGSPITVEIDFQREEVFVGFVGGTDEVTTRVGGYYNWERDETGALAGYYQNNGTSVEGRAYYSGREGDWNASVEIATSFGYLYADTNGKRYASVYGFPIRLKAAKASQAVYAPGETMSVDIYSRPAFLNGQHMLLVYDSGTKLWELTKTPNWRIHFNTPASAKGVEAYKRRWGSQLNGPLTVTVNKAQFGQALTDQEAREGDWYNPGYHNSNYAARWVIYQSITYGIGAGPKPNLGWAPDFIGDPTQ